MTTDAKSLSELIGGQLRALRDRHGLRQDDLAARARQLGLRWDRSTVAGIENGRREVSLGEFVLLPYILSRAVGVPVELPQLLTTEQAWVRVGPDAVVSTEAVGAALHGAADAVKPKELDVPWVRALQGQASGSADARLAPLSALWPGVTAEDILRAEPDVDLEVERRSAARLGVDPLHLVVAAHGRWGRGLTAERDRRSPPEVTSRGYITRALLAELRPILGKAGVLDARYDEED